MDSRSRWLLAVAIVVVGLIGSALVYPELPARMATHWNAAGEVDGTMSRTVGAFSIPVLALALIGLFRVLPRVDPRGENYDAFRSAYDWFVVLFAVFLVYLHGVVLAYNLGYDVSVDAATFPAVGLLFLYLGVLVDRAEPNWFVGIRTPWTLSDDRVWADTHRLGGVLFKLAGLLALLGVVFPAYALYLVLGPVLVAALVPIVYSYYRYQQLERTNAATSR